jgi:hypothetical protein
MRHLLFGSAARVRAAAFGLTASLLIAAATIAPLPAAAAESLTDHTHSLHGLVQGNPSSGATSFTLVTERYGTVTVNFAGATPHGRGRLHGRPRAYEVASAGELKDGERVVVQGRTSSDGKSFVARRVHVLPQIGGHGHVTHLVGTITGVSTSSNGTTLTIKRADGTTASVLVNSETRIRPAGKSISDLTVNTRVTVAERDGTATGVAILT